MPPPIARRKRAKSAFRTELVWDAVTGGALLVASIAEEVSVASGKHLRRYYSCRSRKRRVQCCVRIAEGGCAIGDQQFPAALQHRLEFARTNQVAEALDRFLRAHQIASFLAGPECRELRVGEEHIRHGWSSSAIFQIIEFAIQEERIEASVENHRGIGVVVMIENQFAWRHLAQLVGDGPRRKKRIEYDQSQACGMKKQHHH